MREAQVFNATGKNTLPLPPGAIPPLQLTTIRWCQRNGTQVNLTPIHGFAWGPKGADLETVKEQARELGDWFASLGAEGIDQLVGSGLTLDPAWSDPETQVRWGIHCLGADSPTARILGVLSELVPQFAKLGNLEASALLEDIKGPLKLRGKDIDDLTRDIRAARKEGSVQAEGRRPKLALADLETAHKLHPAIDFLPGVVTVGFRADMGDAGTVLVLAISDGTEVRPEIGVSELEIGGVSYKTSKGLSMPYLNERWSIKALDKFCENPTKPSGLYGDLKEAFATYLDLPETNFGLMAAWAVGTYFAHAFNAFPYLSFEGPKQTGKSTALEALNFVCFNAWKGRDITAACLGDTVDEQRGTVLFDQAEALPQSLVGALSDAYKAEGGRRRVMDMSNSGRRPVEFHTYGPKAFGATNALDRDLKDRCIRTPMVKTKRKLPTLDGTGPKWAKLRDKLYRFLLTAFREVEGHYLSTQGDGTRLTELWRPLLAVLKALGVKAGEIDAIHALVRGSAAETRDELSSWEDRLFDVVKARALRESGRFTMAGEEIRAAMRLGDEGPSVAWVGNTLKTYSLYVERKRRPQVGGGKVMTYDFDPARVVDLCERYQDRGGSTRGVTGATQDDPTPTLDRLDRPGQTPENETCPPQPLEYPGGLGQWTDQTDQSKGIGEEKNEEVLEGPDPKTVGGPIPLCSPVCPKFQSQAREQGFAGWCLYHRKNLTQDNPVCPEFPEMRGY